MSLDPHPLITEKLTALGFALRGEQVPSWERWEGNELITIRIWRSNTIARLLWYIDDVGVRNCEFEVLTPQELWSHIEFTLNLKPHGIG